MNAKAELIDAAKAIMAAALQLPALPHRAPRQKVVAALKRYDAAANKLDQAVEAYIAEARKEQST